MVPDGILIRTREVQLAEFGPAACDAEPVRRVQFPERHAKVDQELAPPPALAWARATPRPPRYSAGFVRMRRRRGEHRAEIAAVVATVRSVGRLGEAHLELLFWVGLAESLVIMM